MNDDVLGFGDEEIPDIPTQIEANTEQRTPCVLVLDCSGSMSSNGRIEALNEGLKSFEEALKNDDIASQRVMVKVLAFGGNAEVLPVTEWTDAWFFEAPTLEANGNTPMGEAMDQAHAEIEYIKGELREGGISYTRPWIFLMSDGGPTDPDWEAAAQRSRAAVQQKKAVVWLIGVPGAQAAPMQAFAGPDSAVYQVDSAEFQGMFQWLSDSLTAAASTAPGEMLQLEAPSRITMEN